MLRAIAMPIAIALLLLSPPERSALTAAAPSSELIVARSVAWTVIPVPLATDEAFSIEAVMVAAILFST